jgi:hypothetical protein
MFAFGAMEAGSTVTLLPKPGDGRKLDVEF